jgi:hypothetical protein
MTHIDDRRLDRRFERLERQLPASAARTLRWLRDPGSTWVRIPVGVLLIFGGLLSFLPILGIWMLPLGLLLLAQDVPFLKRPTSRVMIRLERRWVEWRRRRAVKSEENISVEK